MIDTNNFGAPKTFRKRLAGGTGGTAKIHNHFCRYGHRFQPGEQSLTRNGVHEVKVVKSLSRSIKAATNVGST